MNSNMRKMYTEQQIADIVKPLLPSLSGTISIGQMVNNDDGCYFEHTLTTAEKQNVKDSGIIVIMFNTTTVMIPYVKTYPNRFVCNAIYNDGGDSMVVRAKIEIANKVKITFDDSYALANEITTLPTGVIQFINL